jgi:hypothetical protein
MEPPTTHIGGAVVVVAHNPQELPQAPQTSVQVPEVQASFQT